MPCSKRGGPTRSGEALTVRQPPRLGKIGQGRPRARWDRMLFRQVRSVGFEAQGRARGGRLDRRGYRCGMLSFAAACSSLCPRTLAGPRASGEGRQDPGEPRGVPRGDGPPKPPDRGQDVRARGLEIPAVQDHEGEQLAKGPRSVVRSRHGPFLPGRPRRAWARAM